MNKLRSSAITQGVQRSPNRSMLRAVGFNDEDFNKPIIGCLLYTSPSPRDGLLSRMPSSA